MICLLSIILTIDHFQPWACKIITGLWQYFTVANYSWILMEGLYLHNLVFFALCSDAIAMYILLGWGKTNADTELMQFCRKLHKQ